MNRQQSAGDRMSDSVSSALPDLVMTAVRIVVPIAVIGLLGWMIVDSFTTSFESGLRSLAAAALPVLVLSYIRQMRSEWLEIVERIPSLGVMVGSALATVALVVLLTAGVDAGGAAPEFAVSLALSTMIIARDVGRRQRRQRRASSDETVLNFAFGIALALCLCGVILLPGG